MAIWIAEMAAKVVVESAPPSPPGARRARRRSAAPAEKEGVQDRKLEDQQGVRQPGGGAVRRSQGEPHALMEIQHHRADADDEDAVRGEAVERGDEPPESRGHRASHATLGPHQDVDRLGRAGDEEARVVHTPFDVGNRERELPAHFSIGTLDRGRERHRVLRAVQAHHPDDAQLAA